MTQLLIAGGILLSLLGWFVGDRLSAAYDRIGELTTANGTLEEAAATDKNTISQLERDLATERQINSDRAANNVIRDQSTKEKIAHVDQHNKKGWYGDSLPESAVCLLTTGVQADGSDQDRVCEERSAEGMAQADSGTQVKNEDHTKLTLELQSALDSCNADKADVTEWLESDK